MRRTRLVLGDTLALLAFIFIGRIQHQLAIGVIEVMTAAAPFLIGWLLSGFAAKLYMINETSAGTLAWKTFLHIILGVPAGMLVRVLLTGQGISLTFLIATMIFTAIFIFGWRGVYLGILKYKKS